MSKLLSAKQHAGSGSGNRPHDMHTHESLIECKTVLKGNKQITLKSAYLKSFLKEAALQDRKPVLSIELDGTPWILIPEWDYTEMTAH